MMLPATDIPLWERLAILIPVGTIFTISAIITIKYYLLRWRNSTNRRDGILRLPFFNSLAHRVIPWPTRPQRTERIH